jgi:PAS domain S-box-containing protein
LQQQRDRIATELYAVAQYQRILGMLAGLLMVALAVVLLRRDLRARARAAHEIHQQREWLGTTLRSIGDAVIVTDPHGRVQLFNAVAEQLTGWDRNEAVGRDLAEVFDIINETTREPADDPVRRALAEGRVVGLANHTVLRSRDGKEYVIEDSAAPTYDSAGAIQGAVLVFHDSTERRQAEIALSQASAEIARRAHSALAAESTLATILENAPIGICMTGPAPDFLIIALSSQMRAWIGAAENMPALAVYHKLLPDGREPPPDLIPLNRVMLRGEFVRDEPWLIERKGGDPLTVIVNVAPVKDQDGTIVGAIHTWMDLTERQHLDHQLRVSQSRLRVLLDSNVIGLILSFDSRGHVAQANDAFLDMLGFDAAAVSADALNLVTQTPAEFHAADERAFAEVREAGYCTPYEKEFVSKADGRRVPVVVGYARVADSKDEFVGFALDISARKDLESRLREQAAELRSADRHKNEFLAMLAHELRNPLAPLRNAVHLLTEDAEQGEAAQKAGRAADLVPLMRRQIDHLVRLVDDLLDAARISKGKIIVNKEVVDIVPSLEAAIESMRPLIQQRGHELEIDIPAETFYVDGDSTRLTQMFSNVLHNAAKYTARGGHIHLSLAREAREAVVCIADDGEGIAPHVLPRIFEAFVQDDQSLARSAGGLGVGLALVRNLCELHGGTVSAVSAGRGRGSEFTLRLPLVSGPDATAESQAAISAVAPRRLRILVVDDNIDLAASTMALLEMWGHEVREVHNGREVSDVALAYRPDVILLDIGLPGMDGFQVAAQLSATPELESTRLIAMTGYGQERDRERAVIAGFDAHLVKPVQPAVLKALLDDASA